jgi:exonuclease SbcC
MRPLELSLTGFRSYPTPVTVDFSGKSLAAALGDTGAGKSSLLDAITFALFRKSSWDAKEPRQLIADGVEAMSVELTFLHDGHRWRVHRTMHATNSNAGRHHLTNLDTGAEEDGASAVDARIRAVLQMGYDTFLRVGLLPQGKFDQLLTAAPRERTERLRELFGAESLEATQQLANRHCLSLTKLLGDAKAARAAMPDDPAQVAAVACGAADAAEVNAERLDTAIGNITALQKQTRDTRAAADAAATAARNLLARSVPGATATLDAIEPVAADIASRRGALDRRAANASAQDDDLTTKITGIEDRGEGKDDLGKAAVILEQLAARAEEHRGERDRLASLTIRLAAASNEIADAVADLALRAKQAQPLTNAASAAAKVDTRLRAHATTVRSHVTAAITTALRVAEAAQDRRAADDTLDTVRATAPRLEQEAATAEVDLTTAEERLELLRLRDRAAAIAAELYPGDDCPVCQRQLAANFEPESKTGAAELRDARALVRDSKAKRNNAAEELARVRAAVTIAEGSVSKRAQAQRVAEQNAHQAAQEATQALTEFASLATEAKVPFDADAASAVLLADTAKLASPMDEKVTGSEHATEPISVALAASEQDSAENVERLRANAFRHTAAIEAERNPLNDRTSAHQIAVADAKAALSRHTRAVARTTAGIRALPSWVRELLPDDAIDVSTADTAAAAVAVAARLTEVQQFYDTREAARIEKTRVLTDQRKLDIETRVTMDDPLNTLRASLQEWAKAAAQALITLDIDSGHQVPAAPVESGIGDIRSFATDLAQIATTLGNKLTEAKVAHSGRAQAADADLREQAAGLADVDGFTPDADLTTPQVLHPLVAAAATATKQAQDQRAAQHTAQAQIRPAADLDYAIAAGEARLEALDVLRRELVDAKFLGHLTALNTRALLGIASDLLGQLTDQRFGFADRFDIVSRTSGVAHSPNRLSGGEKFLASLALALALAELHSRSGPRLGSLFLDEGFAALDTAALQSALDALRSQAGGDRLVMVISHLHAVAEAVDDVLWVQRSTAGSTARWLTTAERDELVQADLVSGLQTLA